MASWEEIRNGIFAGESGGDYNALFGYANRPGGQFSNVQVSDMSVNDVMRFTDPSGPYAQTVKGQNGRVATPVGAYQIVGKTLRGAAKALGLTGNERFDRATQDALGQYILSTQGTGAWEGYRGPQSQAPQGGTQMGLLSTGSPMEQAPQTFGQRIKAGARDGSLFDSMALAFNGLRMNPDQGLADTIGRRQAGRDDAVKRNRTAEVLQQIAPAAADLVREGLMSPAEALNVYRDQRSMELASRASEALARGDYQTAYALSLEISPQAAGQAIAQQYGPRNSEVTGGGMYTVNYENGQPTVSVNENVQQAELDRIRATEEARRDNQPVTLSVTGQKGEEADFAAIDTIDQLNQSLGTVLSDFGYDPTSGEFTGPLAGAFGASGWGTGMIGTYTNFSGDASETARARERFDRWRTSYVNDSLQLNAGVQTEGDAQRAAAELGNATTAAAAYSALNDLVRINQQARTIKERSITGRRERGGADQVAIPAAPTAPNLGWRIVE